MACAAVVLLGASGVNAQAATFDPASAEMQLYQLTNADRASVGQPPLAFNPALFSLARDGGVQLCGTTFNGRSRDMLDRNYFSHQVPPCGTFVWPALSAAGISLTGAGENIGWNTVGVQADSVAFVNTQFKNSPGHWANIIGDFNQVGIGAWSVGGKTMYTEIFVNGPLSPGVVVVPSTPPPAPASGHYESLPPARILDTRSGIGTGSSAPVGPGQAIDVPVLGQGGIPATGVSAVWLNVTAANPSDTSYLTIYPSGGPRPTASNLNLTAGHNVANLVEVAPGSNGAVAVYNNAGNADVIFDVAGYVAQSSGTEGLYNALSPSRITDTRPGSGQPNEGRTVGPGQSLLVQVAGVGGVPSTGVGAVVLNMTAVNPSTTSYLTMSPAGQARPIASNLNFLGGQTVANRVAAKLGTGGAVMVYNDSGTADVVIDVSGWYSDGSGPGGALFTSAPSPTRVMDTRHGTGAVPGGSSLPLQLGGVAGIPADAKAVVVNLTATDTSSFGYVTAYPAGVTPPVASDLNFVAHDTVPNLVVVTLGPGGVANFLNSNGTADMVIDVEGWFR